MNKRKLQIFVSSTFTDLKPDRQAAVEAILKSGHIPAGMELFTAGDKTQLEVIKRWIDESDAYMLILGGRYGSIDPATGVGYTEIEYDYASQQGKPLFAVVINEEALASRVREYGTSVIEQNEPKALALFRAKVLSNISSFFSDEKDIKLCVHESLADLRENPLVVGWVPASDVEDTKALREEVRRLKSENDVLKKQAISNAGKSKAPDSPMSEDEVTDLATHLCGIEITIPKKLVADGQSNTADLLTLMMNSARFLVNGVTNAATAGDREAFLYFNVSPKLMVHGLVENEKVAGVRWRRSFITEKGRFFLASVERRLARHKTEAGAGTTPNLEPSPTIAEHEPANSDEGAARQS